jgi:hypothetical protein
MSSGDGIVRNIVGAIDLIDRLTSAYTRFIAVLTAAIAPRGNYLGQTPVTPKEKAQDEKTRAYIHSITGEIKIKNYNIPQLSTSIKKFYFCRPICKRNAKNKIVVNAFPQRWQ